MNLLEQQAANRRRTWLVVAVFIGFFLLLGLGFDLFVLNLSAGSPPVGGVVALGAGSAGALAGLYRGDRAVLASTGARPLGEALTQAAGDEERLSVRQLDNVVEEMAIAAGLPKPAVYVVPDPDPNAFATGRNPEHASVAVTHGLLARLNRQELQGVVAHEVSHIRNYDIRLMTLIAALVGGVVLLSDWARRAMRWGGARGGSRGRGRGGGGAAAGLLFALWLILIVLAPLVGQMLAMAVSRRREYLADASGAELTRDPGALADALEKIESDVRPTQAIKRGSAHLCIADPLGRKVGLRDGFWAGLFATHPPMARRIAALRDMAYQRRFAASRLASSV